MLSYTLDLLSNTSYHTHVWKHEILVHAHGHGFSQSVVAKKLPVTSVAGAVNLWWRTAHSCTVRCMLLAGQEVQL